MSMSLNDQLLTHIPSVNTQSCVFMTRLRMLALRVGLVHHG